MIAYYTNISGTQQDNVPFSTKKISVQQTEHSAEKSTLETCFSYIQTWIPEVENKLKLNNE